MSSEKNGYTLMQQYWEFALDNPGKVTIMHNGFWHYLIYLNNNLHWKKEFGLPTCHTMEVLGIGSHHTYYKIFNDFAAWGFIRVVARARNKYYRSNIIELNLISTYALDAPVKNSTYALDAPVKNSTYARSAFEVPHRNKTIENTFKTEGDFIERILGVYSEVFTDYIIVDLGKERKAAGRLLNAFKKKFVGLSSDEMVDSLREHFRFCKNISDKWYSDNMTLTLMAGKFNEIEKKKKERRRGAAAILEKFDSTPIHK